MQRDDGSLYTKYYDNSGRNDKHPSLYYPGEAALGLTMLYGIDGNTEWVRMAVKVIEFLAKRRYGLPWDQIEADHWALLATRKLLEEASKGGLDDIVDQKVLLEHAEVVVDRILYDQVTSDDVQNTHVTYGGFTLDGRSTPTSTRLEALTAAITFLKGRSTQ